MDIQEDLTLNFFALENYDIRSYIKVKAICSCPLFAAYPRLLQVCCISFQIQQSIC